ncbi:glycosyltransferase family 2 protein [Parvularcula lutaonensis]|uniref:Glycosyltransferase family 2 protein n=1 Tax=Parvularcula lutaonensis TaxID=491923 RepID=A0ABV7MD91_9PROT|nr:glycosyltransferase family 2 protein [Parvularcula lutaonensis]
MTSKPSISVVVPFMNEAGNIAPLIAEIDEALADLPAEILAVDDGSTDQSLEELDAARAEHPRLRVLRHVNNAGQSRAIRTGVLAARADVVATLDGDGQNVPADIPALYRQLTRNDADSNLAMVAGQREGRQDRRSRVLASRLATAFRHFVFGDDSTDTGCGLKVFRRDAFLMLPFFDHMHRYLPILMRREGFVVEYAPVQHRARRTGASKYTNLGRAGVAIRDVLGVLWLQSRARATGGVEEW